MRALSLLLVILCVQMAPAQQPVATRAISLLTNETFLLDFMLKPGNGDRMIYQFNLPPNTVSWYYTFSSEGNSQGRDMVNIAAGTTKAFDKTGITDAAIRLIFGPSAAPIAEIKVCDRTNMELFWNGKDDLAQSVPECYRSRNVKCTAYVNRSMTGPWYLCIRNPSSAASITACINVVANVAEYAPVNRIQLKGLNTVPGQLQPLNTVRPLKPLSPLRPLSATATTQPPAGVPYNRNIKLSGLKPLPK